jgi:hypothetical protein
MDAEILSFLRKYPFSSVRTIESLEIPVSTIHSHLVEKIDINTSLLRWVPHTLTSELPQKRVELSSWLLQVLESHQRVSFRKTVTADESWFLQHYDHRQIWCISADDVPTRVTYTIATPKAILTAFLSIDGTISINWLTLGANVNSDCFCEAYSSRSLRFCTPGALQSPQGR